MRGARAWCTVREGLENGETTPREIGHFKATFLVGQGDQPQKNNPSVSLRVLQLLLSVKGLRQELPCHVSGVSLYGTGFLPS